MLPYLAPFPARVAVTVFEGALFVLTLLANFRLGTARIANIGVAGGALAELDAALGGTSLVQECEAAGFTGKQGQSLVLHLSHGNKGSTTQVLLVGLGRSSDGMPSATQLRTFGLQAAAGLTWRSLEKVGLVVLGESKTSTSSSSSKPSVSVLDLDDIQTSALVSAVLTRATPDRRFMSARAIKQLPKAKSDDVAIHLAGASSKGLIQGTAVAHGARTALELVNSPPNFLNPTSLAAYAERIAHGSDLLECKTMSAEECASYGDHGMQLFLGVGRGSINPPQLIHLRYQSPDVVSGATEKPRRIAVVGKGVTFDSGGYNLKIGEASMIDVMKFDMGGAAATIGTAESIAALQPSGLQVDFIVPACENLVSSNAMLPGSVLTASDGTTVEINNTDAEGRLALADALLYAQAQGAEEIIDVATLTGACIIALGEETAGLFADKAAFANNLLASAGAAGENVWQLPLQHSYAKQLKSHIADLKNTGTRAGGSITAALFLHRFINHEKVSWAHLDIAGPVWDSVAGTGTGFGVATLVHHIINPPASQ
mmetsp:Transcript_16990/g.33184  ORF Transcript_16990/g.33184 Transcript_16990/m.33184 type:complete len:543 (+) Transcript_16990:1787-3415(+)